MLFEMHCSNCHGIGGNGGRAPRLDAANLQMDDHSLVQVIRRGLGQGSMPAFRETLSVSDTLRVVAYLRAAGEAPAAIVPGDRNRGRTLFFTKGNCSTCHVIGDEEGGVLGPDLRAIGRLRGPAYCARNWSIRNSSARRSPGSILIETLAGARESGMLLTRRLVLHTVSRWSRASKIVSQERVGFLRGSFERNSHAQLPRDLLGRRARRYGGLPGGPGAMTMERPLFAGLVLLLAGITLSAQHVSYDRALKARRRPRALVTYSGAYDGRRFSTLKQVTAANVHTLRPAWIFQQERTGRINTSPIVVDGMMYIATSRRQP